VTQSRDDLALTPPVFTSRYVSEGRWLDGSASDADYPDRLYTLLCEYDRPVLFCAGAASLNAVSRQRERFAQVCDFLIAPPEVLDALNDKEAVHSRCLELGIPVPRQYDGEPDAYPVVIKPHCGERFGLKARDRYAVANNAREYAEKRAAMEKYGGAPIVQQKVDGAGAGASLLLGRGGELVAAVCHRRIREFPATGGPSTCCESFYDEGLIATAYRLLASFGFTGMAMVEFKGEYVLEVNPRVWGSFPMTERTDSPFACRYARCAAGERVEYAPGDYKTGVRMRFTLNDGAAMLDYLRHGRPGPFFAGMADWFRAEEALYARDDPAPWRRYLRNMLLRR
ncbi:MAG: ATP-grasp domain-containing protein, partial [Butyricicoccus sp.]|nr:ATP-grasp domain-containing protein [Butyricicoccus sp.]